MAATLADSVYSLSDNALALALSRLTPGSVAYTLLAAELDARADYDPDEDGSDAYVRHLELLGYDEARWQEDREAMLGIPA